MPFRVIRGTYHVVNYAPDGDSIRFKADNVANWTGLTGPPAKRNALDHVQLRLEAIDTLETHYQGFHQPPPLAEAAGDALLALLGITDVVWNTNHTKVTAANDGVAGYILTREVEQNRRPIAFAYAGVPPEADGSDVFLDAARLKQSINAKMLRNGMAYPTYYLGLFPDLRAALTAEAAAARADGLGVRPVDKTEIGFAVTDISSITDTHVILPKLFRRLVTYLEAGGLVTDFPASIMTEEVLIISSGHLTHFDSIVTVTGNVVRMTEPPENLLFGV